MEDMSRFLAEHENSDDTGMGRSTTINEGIETIQRAAAHLREKRRTKPLPPHKSPNRKRFNGTLDSDMTDILIHPLDQRKILKIVITISNQYIFTVSIHHTILQSGPLGSLCAYQS